jgi:hypothetical protein
MRKLRLVLAVVLLMLVAMATIAEITVRALVRRNPETGIEVLGRVALLPYRPDALAAQTTLRTASTSTYVVFDKELGWAIRPYGSAGKYTATSHGFRGPKGGVTTKSLPRGKWRVSVYGDSFTHGDGVALEETWADQLQRRSEGLEVLNFGVPAFGTDQALLRFRRDGREFDSHVHVLGVWPENLARNVSVVRFYMVPSGNLGGSKPRFVLASGRMQTVNSPVLSQTDLLQTLLHQNVSPVLSHDYWYKEDEQRFPWYFHLQSLRMAVSVLKAYERRAVRNRMYLDEDGEPMMVTLAIAETFRDEVEALGAKALVAVFPMRDFADAERFPLPHLLKARGVSVVDLQPAFTEREKQLGTNALYLPDGHLTPLGNRLVAEELGKRLPIKLAPAR